MAPRQPPPNSGQRSKSPRRYSFAAARLPASDLHARARRRRDVQKCSHTLTQLPASSLQLAVHLRERLRLVRRLRKPFVALLRRFGRFRLGLLFFQVGLPLLEGHGPVAVAVEVVEGRVVLLGDVRVGLRGASQSLDSVRTASKSKKKPPTTSSDGHESRRRREGTAAPRDAEILLRAHGAARQTAHAAPDDDDVVLAFLSA